MNKRGGAAGRWREIVRTQGASGLSVAGFCRRSRIPHASRLISGGGAADTDGNGIPDVCESVVPDPPVGTGEPARTNRYLRFSAPAPTVAGAAEEVIRISFTSLDGYPIVFTTLFYLGPPFQAPEEDSAQPGLTFTVTPLQCDPYAHNWSAEGIISAYGAEIMPGSTYEVQRADAGCPNLLSDEGCWSEPLTITTAKYGDVWPLFDAPGNPPQPDFNDIAAVVRKFQSTASECTGGSNDGMVCAGAPDCPGGTCDITAPLKARCQLQPNCVFPDRPIDFKDIAATVRAFVGEAYSDDDGITGPCACPSAVTCGATTCGSSFECPGGFCIDGFCTDTCGRCTP